jgi:hypothetical protein
MNRLCICVAVAVASVACRASAAVSLEYFAWDEVATDTYAASAGGIGGSLAFSTAGDDIMHREDIPETAADFVATYGPLVPALKMINGGAGGSDASASAAVQFDAPLPAGSRLIAFDVDAGGAINERFQFTHTSGTFTLIDQLESQAGASSIFPSWSAVTGTLTAQRLNDEEASVFDVSGVESLTVNYLRNTGGSGFTGARFAIGVPVVPEPACVGTLSAAAVLAGLGRRGRRTTR